MKETPTNGLTWSWSHLNSQQIGKYAEYYVKMQMTRLGCEVYSSEVDDRGIDFVVKLRPGHYAEIQVKSLRYPKNSYVFFRKDKLGATQQEIEERLRTSFFIALVLFQEKQAPEIFLVPGRMWLNPDKLFVDRDYEGLKSKPEFGISLSRKSLDALDAFRFTSLARFDTA